MPVEVRYYTDPACSWSWGSEPKLRRLMWEFGDGLRFTWVMGGLARTFDRADLFSEMATWLDAAAESGMPIDPRLWTRNPISSSYPGCLAVKAAAEQGSDAAYRYLRRLREGLMTERKKLDHPDALVGEAGPTGLDMERFRIDLASNAITEAFAADLEAVRDAPREACAQDRVGETVGRERMGFPSVVFRGEDGTERGIWGWSRYDAYREAAIAGGAAPVQDPAPDPIASVQRFGRCTTRELEALTAKPGPVLQAELWGLARDWRLKPVPVLGGTFWELP
jgi:predicted DsbA family dithiol-disulfide isomerase